MIDKIDFILDEESSGLFCKIIMIFTQPSNITNVVSHHWYHTH